MRGGADPNLNHEQFTAALECNMLDWMPYLHWILLCGFLLLLLFGGGGVKMCNSQQSAYWTEYLIINWGQKCAPS